MVTVMRGGEEVKISKRAGSYVTLRDLIEEVGRDATRYFFVMRKPDSQLVFDIDLAKRQTLDNPVYYVQYAHARICSIFENATEKGLVPESFDAIAMQRLAGADDMVVIKKLAGFPEIVAGAAENFEPHRLTGYLQEVAGEFHSYYNRSRVIIIEDPELSAARLFLLRCIARVLRNGLALLGISAPEKM
jgi:arginyl-tRNA synthetase